MTDFDKKTYWDRRLNMQMLDKPIKDPETGKKISAIPRPLRGQTSTEPKRHEKEAGSKHFDVGHHLSQMRGHGMVRLNRKTYRQRQPNRAGSKPKFQHTVNAPGQGHRAKLHAQMKKKTQTDYPADMTNHDRHGYRVAQAKLRQELARKKRQEANSATPA